MLSIICRYQDEGYDDYKDKRKQKKKKSMMSLMQGDEYLDPSVAIEEGEVSVVWLIFCSKGDNLYKFPLSLNN